MAKKKLKRKPPRNAKKAPRQTAMRITKGRGKLIAELSDMLAAIAPGTARGEKSFCVKNVAAAYGDKKLWKDLANKKQSIAAYLHQLFRRFPNKPKRVILEIVCGGVVWTARKGKTVSTEQLTAISEKLNALGIKASKEISQIEIPEPSQIKRPADDLVAVLNGIELHESIAEDCIDLFEKGHLNDSVRKALERFEKLIQDKTGLHDIGKALMAKAFNHQNPLIAINDGTGGNAQSEQEGFMHLTMGAMAGVRNLYSHGDVDTIEPMDAFERLCFVSMLFKRISTAGADDDPEDDA